MAEQLISPAVQLNEYDQSYLPTAIGNIGAAVVGPTLEGPAFTPTIVTSYSDFTSKFGGASDDTYVPYAVKAYLENAGTMTVVRTLGLYGYGHTKAVALVMSGSALGTKVISVLHNTNRTTTGEFSASVSGSGIAGAAGWISASSFVLTLSGSVGFWSGSTYFSTSMDSTANSYLGKAIGTSPKTNVTTGTYAYRYVTFEKAADLAITASGATIAAGVTASYVTIDLSGSNRYSEAYTPWITSQYVGGALTDLFKFHTISHGNDMNAKYKIGISNVKRPSELTDATYGTFTVVVRQYDDTDRVPQVLETYNNVSLDPDSANYICKVIGDTYYTYDATYKKLIKNGDYANKSSRVYVEVADGVKNKTNSGDLVPYGFRPVFEPLVVTSYSFPTASMVTAQTYNSAYNSKVYFGFNFDFDTTDNANYLMPIDDAATTGSNVVFNLDNYFNNAAADTNAGASLSGSSANLVSRKFIVPFQGGYDGFDPSRPKYTGDDIVAANTMGFDISSGTATGYTSYKRAIDLLSNQDMYDINMLVTPGVLSYYHSSIVSYAIDMCESRGDCFYIFDNCQLSEKSIANVTDQAANYDTSYAATYYPWIKIFDADRNKYIWTPPSVPVIGAMSYNDRNGYEWFAPAGLNRGALSTAKDVYVNLTQPERDDLYDGRVNPIASFPNEGIVVWGQKTLQVKSSALDRINVRRLMINIKKYIASSTKYLLFEGNTVQTRNRFKNMVNPYMDSIQQKSGLYAFKVKMDETNNTPDIIDRNILYGQIWLQPTKTSEFIIVDLNITPTGATFGD